MRPSWTPFALCLIALVALAAPADAQPAAGGDAHEWVRDIRRATASDHNARACAVPQLIRYQSTLALLRRAAEQPGVFSRAAVKGWRLRLLELKRSASSCLANANGAPQRAVLVVEVDLPPGVFTEGYLDGESWTQLADKNGPARDLLTPALRR